MSSKKKAPAKQLGNETQRISTDELAALLKQSEKSAVESEEGEVFGDSEPAAKPEPPKKK